MNSKTSENKSLLPKSIHFRPLPALDEAIKTLMETHKINKTEAIEHIFREWQILTRQKPEIETDLEEDLEFPECKDWRQFDKRTGRYECLNPKPPVNLKHFSKLGLIAGVCRKCKNVKVIEKATEIRHKTVKKQKVYQYPKKKKEWEDKRTWADPTQPYFEK